MSCLFGVFIAIFGMTWGEPHLIELEMVGRPQGSIPMIDHNPFGSLVEALLKQKEMPIQISGMKAEHSQLKAQTGGGIVQKNPSQAISVKKKKTILKALQKKNKHLSQKILALAHADYQLHHKLNVDDKKNEFLTPDQEKEKTARKAKVAELRTEINEIHGNVTQTQGQLKGLVKQEHAKDIIVQGKKKRIQELTQQITEKEKLLNEAHDKLFDNIKAINALKKKVKGLAPIIKNLHQSLIVQTQIINLEQKTVIIPVKIEINANQPKTDKTDKTDEPKPTKK